MVDDLRKNESPDVHGGTPKSPKRGILTVCVAIQIDDTHKLSDLLYLTNSYKMTAQVLPVGRAQMDNHER
jgi:hypothetical protein